MKDIARVSAIAVDELEKLIYGKRDVLERFWACVLSEGHLLLEDVPGTGKTVLAKGLAQILGASFQRVQCTADLLPGDITGSSIFNQKTNEFEFHAGPIFTQILLADEINRATPRAQAALLECMAESQVSVDGSTYDLERPFFVVATQNPVEHEGTFALPEAQLDRFAMRLSIGYPDSDAELRLLMRRDLEPLRSIKRVLSGDQLIELQRQTRRVRVAFEVAEFMIRMVGETRSGREFLLGGGPRATISLCRTSQAFAAMKGRAFVLPDDAKYLFPAVLGHRVILSAEARIEGLTAEAALAAAASRVEAPIEARIDAGECRGA